jgi:RimJ/RimL family protein N-acetyltransferase
VITLQAGALRLQPLVQAHAEALYPLLADPLLYTFMDHGPPASEAALQGVYAKLESRRSPDGTEQWLNWAVFDDQGQALGFVQATVLSGHRAWVAYVLGRAHWGRGHARAATAAMLSHLGQDHGVRHCLACVERANIRSLSLLHHLGFEVADEATAAQQALTPTEVLLVRAAPVAPPPPGSARDA